VGPEANAVYNVL